eukprot:4871095-Prymnesium_polylepis.1
MVCAAASAAACCLPAATPPPARHLRYTAAAHPWETAQRRHAKPERRRAQPRGRRVTAPTATRRACRPPRAHSHRRRHSSPTAPQSRG